MKIDSWLDLNLKNNPRPIAYLVVGTKNASSFTEHFALDTKIGIEPCDLHFWPQVRVLQGASQDSRRSPKTFSPLSEGLVISPFTSSPPVKREKFR